MPRQARARVRPARVDHVAPRRGRQRDRPPARGAGRRAEVQDALHHANAAQNRDGSPPPAPQQPDRRFVSTEAQTEATVETHSAADNGGHVDAFLPEHEEGCAKAIKAYKILAGLFGLLGVILLACGIAAAASPNSQSFGLPYFLGGFIVGILTLTAAAVCTCIFMKAPDADNEVKKRELGCAIQGQYIVAMFTIFGCFIGCISAGLGGISSSSHYDEENEDSPKKTLAIIILIGCIVGIFLTIYSMFTVCTYGSYFGIQMQRGRRGRMVLINTGVSSSVSTVHAAPLQTTSHTSNQVKELEIKNRLLQQQLDLQKQIFQQQQQHQQQQQQQQQQHNQLSAGFYPPPPPPEYPPPSYS